MKVDFLLGGYNYKECGLQFSIPAGTSQTIPAEIVQSGIAAGIGSSGDVVSYPVKLRVQLTPDYYIQDGIKYWNENAIEVGGEGWIFPSGGYIPITTGNVMLIDITLPVGFSDLNFQSVKGPGLPYLGSVIKGSKAA